MLPAVQQVLENVHGAWRFRWYAILLAWVLGMLGWTAVFFWPDMYQANARVFVDTRTALRPVLQGLNVEQDVNAELNFARQSLLGTPLLTKLALETDLLTPAIKDQRERDKVIEEMRQRIIITARPAAESGGELASGGSVYALIYKDESRDRGLQIVQSLVKTFVEDTLGGKREGSKEAQEFLETQIHDYEIRLREAENRLAEFKKSNVDVMPSEQGSYFTRFQAEMDAVRAGESALAVATSKREEIRRQLRGEAVISASGAPTVLAPGQAVAGGDLTSRIRDAQANLDELRLRFTDRHPDVIAAQGALTELQRRRDSEIESLRRGDANAVASSGASANPVYQSVQLALNQANVEIATLQRQLADHRTRVTELRAALNTMPQVEAQFAQLNRDYDVNKTQFTALLTQLEKAKLGQEADNKGSVGFRIIEPPNVSFKPVTPRRGLTIAIVLIAALAAGGALAYGLHLLSPVYWSAKMLGERTGIAVLGTLSSGFPLAVRREMRRSTWLFAATACGLVVVGVIVLRASQLGLRFALPAAG